MGAHQRIRIIKLRACKQIEAALVDENPRPALFNHQVVRGGRRFVQIEFILEAAAAAGEDRDAKRGWGRLGPQNFGNARGGAIG